MPVQRSCLRLTHISTVICRSINSQQVIDYRWPKTHEALLRTLADPTTRALFERYYEGAQTVAALTVWAVISHGQYQRRR